MHATVDTDTPYQQWQPSKYLLVRRGGGGVWPVPTCGGFRLGGRSPTSDECIYDRRQREDRETVQTWKLAQDGSVARFEPVSTAGRLKQFNALPLHF